MGCSDGFGVAGIVRHPHIQLQAPARTAVEEMQDPRRPRQGPSLRGQVASAETAGVTALGGGPEGRLAATWQRETLLGGDFFPVNFLSQEFAPSS